MAPLVTDLLKVTRGALVVKENLNYKETSYMSNTIQKITNSLESLIDELSSNPSLYLKNPNTNFSGAR